MGDSSGNRLRYQLSAVREDIDHDGFSSGIYDCLVEFHPLQETRLQLMAAGVEGH